MLAALLLVSGWPAGHAAVNATVTPPVPYVPVYNLTDLGTVSGDTDSWANGINASGEVTGWSFGSEEQAFRYSGSTMTGLGVLHTGDLSEGLAINASGEVAGVSGDLINFSNPYRAVTWTGTTATDISGGVNSFANGINDAGDVVGYTEATPGTSVAFLYHSGTLTDLNTLVTGGDTMSLHEGLAINTSGQIAGYGRDPSNRFRAFLFDSGVVTDLGILGSTASDGSIATAMNDAGHIAGLQFGAINHPFYWDGSMHDLGVLSGYPYGEAWGINATDWVVGEVYKNSGNSTVSRAFVRAPGGSLVDLNTRVKLPAGWVLEFANGINDSGQIVGEALVNGFSHAYRLTPSNVTRIFGATRYDTAAMIAAKNYTNPQATVYIANGQNFPDGLAGAALAGRDGAPLLLVPATGALPASVHDELVLLAPTKIVIFGGNASVSPAMYNLIQAAVPLAALSRIGGADRYATASLISSQDYTAPQATVYIANGQNFPDALAGAALAGRDGAPLLLVPATGALPTSVHDELVRLGPTKIVVFGGTGSVSTPMLANIQAAVSTAAVSRIFGATRYDTAAAIATAGYTNPQATVYFANGQNFPDALAGAALAGRDGAPLLLAPTSGALVTSVTTELGALDPTHIVIFGGTGAISTQMEELIAQY